MDLQTLARIFRGWHTAHASAAHSLLFIKVDVLYTSVRRAGHIYQGRHAAQASAADTNY